MTTESEDPWREHVLRAESKVQRAREGDVLAAQDVLRQSAVALRGILQQRDLPDPERTVYLQSLLASLEAIDKGVPPSDALALGKPGHRLADPNLPVRDVFLFVQVGQEFDKLTSAGTTRQDKPLDQAMRFVAKQNQVSLPTVSKAWSNHGSQKGWEACRSDWGLDSD